MPVRPPKHRPPGFKPFDLRRQELEDARPGPRRRGYDATWDAFRRAVIARYPFCSVCGSTHRLNLDHIKTVREAPELRLDAANVRVLCHSCHSKRTIRDQGWHSSE